MIDDIHFEFSAGSTVPSAVPNYSFESSIVISAETPNDWFTFNDLAVLFLNQPYITETTDATVGASAIQVTTTAENVAADIPSIVTNGTFNFATDSFEGGTAFIATPDVFSYDVRYVPSGTDTALVWLRMWNATSGDIIDTFDIITTSAATYETRTITLGLTEAPDSVWVLGYSGNQAGSVLKLDNILFTGGDIGFKEEPLFSDLRIHPNPATGNTTILFDSADEISIVNLAGQVMFRTADAANGKLIVDVNSWNEGVYFVRLTDSGKSLTRKLVVSH